MKLFENFGVTFKDKIYSFKKKNKAHDLVVDSIHGMYQYYIQNLTQDEASEPIVLKIMNLNENNIFENNGIVETLLVRFGIKMININTTEEYLKKLYLDESTGKLYYNKHEVAVAYFRNGYKEKDYQMKNPLIIQLRELTEKSLAINIPSVKVHLLGMKIFQKFFITEEFLNKIGVQVNEVENIKKLSTEIYNIDIDFKSNKDLMINKFKNYPEK